MTSGVEPSPPGRVMVKMDRVAGAEEIVIVEGDVSGL